METSGRWVIPHERTIPGQVAARLELLQTTQADLSPIFAVYRGRGRALAALTGVSASQPLVAATNASGVCHKLWAITDKEQIRGWRQAMAPKQILVADGHHRYRAALEYRAKIHRNSSSGTSAPWDDTLMLLVDIDVHGPRLQAIHRLLHPPVSGEKVLAALADEFEVERAQSAADAETAIASLPATTLAYGMYADSSAWVLRARRSRALRDETSLRRHPLDVEVLHGPVFGRLLGIRDIARQVSFEGHLASATRAVDNGIAASLLILRPLHFQRVLEIASNGETLPPKSTLFQPKPWDGLITRTIDH
jgi:uncharacterized protein (DUF1015 family)